MFYECMGSTMSRKAQPHLAFGSTFFLLALVLFPLIVPYVVDIDPLPLPILSYYLFQEREFFVWVILLAFLIFALLFRPLVFMANGREMAPIRGIYSSITFSAYFGIYLWMLVSMNEKVGGLSAGVFSLSSGFTPYPWVFIGVPSFFLVTVLDFVSALLPGPRAQVAY